MRGNKASGYSQDFSVRSNQNTTKHKILSYFSRVYNQFFQRKLSLVCRFWSLVGGKPQKRTHTENGVHVLRRRCPSTFTAAHSLPYFLPCAFQSLLSVLWFFPYKMQTQHSSLCVCPHATTLSPLSFPLQFLCLKPTCWEGQHVLEIEVEALELKHLEVRKSWSGNLKNISQDSFLSLNAIVVIILFSVSFIALKSNETQALNSTVIVVSLPIELQFLFSSAGNLQLFPLICWTHHFRSYIFPFVFSLSLFFSYFVLLIPMQFSSLAGRTQPRAPLIF